MNTLHGRFEAVARACPDAIALVVGAKHMSYRLLNARAEQLARALACHQVGTEKFVAVLLEPSLDLVIAILGILKAGAAYLPLDPQWPKSRIEQILDDASISVMVTTDRSGWERPGLVVVPPLVSTEVVGRDPPSFRTDCLADQAAYLIYTSGSTGRPKGVIVTHRNVLRLFDESRDYFDFKQSDVWTLFHSAAFDFSVWEIWGSLLHGAQLVICPFAATRAPATFARLVVDQEVTVLNQTPTAFRQLIAHDAETGTLPAVTALRYVIFGGERLDLKILARWYAAHGERAQLVNMYGITETTVHVTWKKLAAVECARPDSPLGRPIRDLQVTLVDGSLTPQPVGIVGELLVGGPGLSRGYLGRPALTAERFIPDAFTGQSGGRLYRSGDLASQLPNGELVYIGREDEQVKVNGFRIELGEIEAAVRTYSGVSDTLVVLWETAHVPSAGSEEGRTRDESMRHFLSTEDETVSRRRQLVAYIILHPANGLDPQALFAHLRELLPVYMLPATIVTLDQFPLTINGKIDRAALPNPAQHALRIGPKYVAPRTDAERIVAQAWERVLGVERVGVEDNYFALGGDSIKAIAIVSEIKRAGLVVFIEDIYRHHTLAQIARVARLPAAAVPVVSPDAVPPSPWDDLPVGVEQLYPLARIQAGILFHQQADRDPKLYHDVFLYKFRLAFDASALERAVQQTVDRHPILRTSFDLAAYHEPTQLVHSGVAAHFQIVDARGMGDPELASWIEQEKNHRLESTVPSLIRFFAYRTSDSEFYLVLSFHDAILDGWSTASLVTEVIARYHALLTSTPREDLDWPLGSFRRFVERERSTIADPASRVFWTRHLEDCTATLVAPRTPRLSATSVNIKVLRVPIAAELGEALKQIARELGVGLKYVLLAAHSRVVGALTGRHDVIVGVESNGRLEEEGGDRVLGMHLNTVPFRIRLAAGTWAELVHQVFCVENEAHSYKRYPYPEIQNLCGGEPLFDVAFNYTHFHVFGELQELAGLGVLDARGFGQTHFALRAEFNREPFSDEIHLDLECDLARITLPRLEQIAGSYKDVLAALANNPSARQEHLNLEPGRNVPRALFSDESGYEPVHVSIDVVARRTPHKTAVICGARHVTYGALAALSDQLAARLLALGAGPECPVGLLADRSVFSVAAFLAILKSGACFVPLDISAPRERLHAMIRQSGIRFVVDPGRIDDHFDVPIVRFEEALLKTPVPTLQGAWAHPHSSAYMIFTSGSTGAPKPVVIERRNLFQSTRARQCYYTQVPETFLLLPPFCFDSALAPLFWTLVGGGTLVLPTESELTSMPALEVLLQRHSVTHWLSVPTLLRLFFSADTGSGAKGLRSIVSAGEPLDPALVRLIAEHAPAAQIFNEYGPAECSVWATVHEVTKDHADIPIGRAAAHVHLTTLDEFGQRTLGGVAGEICIGGPGVGRGYRGAAGITADRFRPDPHGGLGARRYHTGDYGDEDATGVVRFHGRLDSQIKVNGCRVELGEVESALRRQPQVSDAHADVRPNAVASRQIVAFVVNSSPSALTPAELRRRLMKELPRYMIPGEILVVPSLPRLVSGKIDRAALRQLFSRPKPTLAEVLTRLEQLPDDASVVCDAKRALAIA